MTQVISVLGSIPSSHYTWTWVCSQSQLLHSGHVHLLCSQVCIQSTWNMCPHSSVLFTVSLSMKYSRHTTHLVSPSTRLDLYTTLGILSMSTPRTWLSSKSPNVVASNSSGNSWTVPMNITSRSASTSPNASQHRCSDRVKIHRKFSTFLQRIENRVENVWF